MRCQSRISSASAASLSALTPARRRAALIIALKHCGNSRSLGACASVVIIAICSIAFSWFLAVEPVEKIFRRWFFAGCFAVVRPFLKNITNIKPLEFLLILKIVEEFL
jgi:hypothetical protein